MAKKAFMLVNLGSPDSTSVKDVRTYLNEFLMDERVIDIPYFWRFLLVRGIIAPFRAMSSAKKYKTIWTDKGSPLIYLTKELTELFEQHTGTPAYMSMRYATPTPTATFDQIEQDHPDLEELTVIPLYPHYAMSSYETAVEHVKAAFAKRGAQYDLKIVPPYFKHEDYIKVLADSIRPYIKDNDFDLLLFSYHGVPERHILKSDFTQSHCLKGGDCCSKVSEVHDVCYRHQVYKTTELVREQLGLAEEKTLLSFQSRLGRDPWLQPYTAATLEELPKQGVKKIVVVSPAFVSDCLETLEEIHEEGQEIFLEAGGQKFTSVPCLNTRADWVEALSTISETSL